MTAYPSWATVGKHFSAFHSRSQNQGPECRGDVLAISSSSRADFTGQPVAGGVGRLRVTFQDKAEFGGTVYDRTCLGVWGLVTTDEELLRKGIWLEPALQGAIIDRLSPEGAVSHVDMRQAVAGRERQNCYYRRQVQEGLVCWTLNEEGENTAPYYGVDIDENLAFQCGEFRHGELYQGTRGQLRRVGPSRRLKIVHIEYLLRPSNEASTREDRTVHWDPVWIAAAAAGVSDAALDKFQACFPFERFLGCGDPLTDQFECPEILSPAGKEYYASRKGRPRVGQSHKASHKGFETAAKVCYSLRQAKCLENTKNAVREIRNHEDVSGFRVSLIHPVTRQKIQRPCWNPYSDCAQLLDKGSSDLIVKCPNSGIPVLAMELQLDESIAAFMQSYPDRTFVDVVCKPNGELEIKPPVASPAVVVIDDPAQPAPVPEAAAQLLSLDEAVNAYVRDNSWAALRLLHSATAAPNSECHHRIEFLDLAGVITKSIALAKHPPNGDGSWTDEAIGLLSNLANSDDPKFAARIAYEGSWIDAFENAVDPHTFCFNDSLDQEMHARNTADILAMVQNITDRNTLTLSGVSEKIRPLVPRIVRLLKQCREGDDMKVNIWHNLWEARLIHSLNQ